MKTTGEIVNGKLELDREYFKKEISKMKDGKITIEIKPYTKNTSEQQRRYYWGCVVRLISEHTGMEETDVHYSMKYKFIPDKEINKDAISTIIQVPKQYIIQIKSITKLSTKEMEEYLEKIRRWSSEFLAFYIPEPNEAEKLGIIKYL